MTTPAVAPGFNFACDHKGCRKVVHLRARRGIVEARAKLRHLGWSSDWYGRRVDLCPRHTGRRR